MPPSRFINRLFSLVAPPSISRVCCHTSCSFCTHLSSFASDCDHLVLTNWTTTVWKQKVRVFPVEPLPLQYFVYCCKLLKTWFFSSCFIPSKTHYDNCLIVVADLSKNLILMLLNGHVFCHVCVCVCVRVAIFSAKQAYTTQCIC